MTGTRRITERFKSGGNVIMEEKRTKFGFFRQIGTAVAKPKQYERFLPLSIGRVIIFVLVFTLITSFVGNHLVFVCSQIFGDSYKDMFKKYAPEFQLEDGILTVLSDPLHYDDGTTLVIVNSDTESFDEAEAQGYLDQGYMVVYLFGRTNMIMASGEQISPYMYSELSKETLDKEGLYDYIPSLYLLYALSGFFNYLAALFFYFFGALLLMLVGGMIMSIWRVRLSYGELFTFGVYSKVLFEIVAAVLGALGLMVPMRFFIGIITGFIYLCLVFRYLRSTGYKSGSIPKEKRSMFGARQSKSTTGIYSKASMRTTELNGNDDASGKKDQDA